MKILRIALLLILLVGAGCAPRSDEGLPELAAASFTASPAPTDTIDWFPATGTPTPVSTRVETTTPTPELGLSEVLLTDDFSQSGQMSVYKTANGSAAYGRKEFTLAVAAARGYLTSLRSQPELGDFYLEVSANPSLCREGDSYGLLLRAANEWNYYRWVVTCSGETRLERVKDGFAVLLQDWLYSAQIPQGPEANLRLGVWMHGDQMRFFIDGVEQFDARDPLWTSGLLGFFARAKGDTPLTVNFSDLSVRAIDPLALPSETVMPSITSSP